jgi:V-type H+-transporting ATPase subunit H
VHLNKHEFLANVFLEYGGASFLLDCFNRSGNDIQLIYYTLLNVWMLSFIPETVEKLFGTAKFGVIKHICEILQKVSREKITRVAFMIFKNIQHEHTCLELMIDNRLLKIIDTILKGNIKDEELITEIKDIGTILESNIRVLSSFDKYVKEVNSETLDWSSVHNERFWKENAIKFEANEYHLIKYPRSHSEN